MNEAIVIGLPPPSRGWVVLCKPARPAYRPPPSREVKAVDAVLASLADEIEAAGIDLDLDDEGEART